MCTSANITKERHDVASANIVRNIARVSLGTFAAAGLLFGPAISAGAASPDQPVQPDSAVTPLDTSDVGAQNAKQRRELHLDKGFLNRINVARAHPELYPPHGNARGAVMTPCATPLQFSSALRHTARPHNNYLVTRPIEWVNKYPNMHRNPNGNLAWEPGEPIDQAGYHSRRAEIVATGQPTSEAALQYWMQDDAASGWGHRNLILDCTIKEAGPGRLHGGPGNHYWTVDMGTR
jgi:hypothetical protein